MEDVEKETLKLHYSVCEAGLAKKGSTAGPDVLLHGKFHGTADLDTYSRRRMAWKPRSSMESARARSEVGNHFAEKFSVTAWFGQEIL